MGFYLNKTLLITSYYFFFIESKESPTPKMMGKVSSVVLRNALRSNKMRGVVLRRGFQSSGGAKQIQYLPANSAQNLLPFNPYQNRWGLLLKIGLIYGSGFALPFFVMVFTNWKKNGFTA